MCVCMINILFFPFTHYKFYPILYIFVSNFIYIFLKYIIFSAQSSTFICTTGSCFILIVPQFSSSLLSMNEFPHLVYFSFLIMVIKNFLFYFFVHMGKRFYLSCAQDWNYDILCQAYSTLLDDSKLFSEVVQRIIHCSFFANTIKIRLYICQIFKHKMLFFVIFPIHSQAKDTYNCLLDIL